VVTAVALLAAWALAIRDAGQPGVDTLAAFLQGFLPLVALRYVIWAIKDDRTI
jgi:hypothetical protein